jgi:phytoene synthase
VVTQPLTAPQTSDREEHMLTLASHGKTFHWASFFLTKKQARAAAKLYACCRDLDDLADSSTHSKLTKAQTLKALRLALENPNKVACSSLEAALQSLTSQHQIPTTALASLLDGLITDTEAVAITNKSELDRYCFRVAGTVGLMMCPILGVRDERALPFAIDLGMAMQLTNICRDVLEDAELGRRYLPLDITPTEIRYAPDVVKTRVQHAIADQLQRAEFFYQSGLRGLTYLPRRSRVAILVAAHLYRAIGRKLRDRNFEWWKGRTIVSPKEKFILTLKLMPTLLFVMLQPKPTQHSSHLHANLEGLPHVNHPQG